MKVTKLETLYHKDHGATLKHKCGKRIVALSLFIFYFWGLPFFAFLLFFIWDNALLMMIITLLFIYNSMITTRYLEQNMTLYECLRRCTGICNESRVTCMKELWTMAFPQILCQLQYHAKQYDNDERVIINGIVESCMAIYLGMAMEMP